MNSSERLVESPLAAAHSCIGQLVISRSGEKYLIRHRDDANEKDLAEVAPENAIEIATRDDAGNYRPLKTAPNLRHGWKLVARTSAEVAYAVEAVYPGRLGALRAWQSGRLLTTCLRDTLNRQSGMYRVAAEITDRQLEDVVANFCRSDGGCLRTILWKRDAAGTVPSTKLPREKFDPTHDQSGRGEACIPLLCQEACQLLINECRKAVKEEL